MTKSRRRSRERAGSYGSLTHVCGLLLVGALIVGVSLPSASFSRAEVPRGAVVGVTADENGALGLDRAQAVYINDTSALVNVTNHLGRDVTITVALRTDSTHIGDLVVDDREHGEEASFTLTRGATKSVEMSVPDNSSLTDEVVYFDVTASEPGLTAKSPDREVPVNG